MSDAVVTLKLQSGERFEGVALGGRERTLAEFLDSALKGLEVSLVSACVGHAGGIGCQQVR